MRGSTASPPAIVAPADRFELNRCRCPACLGLDARYPGQGFQLALLPYIVTPSPLGTRSEVVSRLDAARKRRDARVGK